MGSPLAGETSVEAGRQPRGKSNAVETPSHRATSVCDCPTNELQRRESNQQVETTRKLGAERSGANSAFQEARMYARFICRHAHNSAYAQKVHDCAPIACNTCLRADLIQRTCV